MRSPTGSVRTPAAAVISALLVLALVSCNNDSPTAPTPPGPGACTFQLAPSTQTLESTGGSVTIAVTTNAQCSWSARSDADWMTITAGATGTGPGTVSLSASSNPATSVREAGVTVASQAVRFTQRARADCTFTVSAPSQRFGPDGGRGQIAVEAAAECRWTASSAESWLTLSTTSGTGTAQIDYTVSPYSGTAERSVQVTVAEKTLTFRQDPVQRQCEYSAAPADFRLHWHGIVRTSSHSAHLEVEFTRRNIPFVKFGGLKFVEPRTSRTCWRTYAGPRIHEIGWRLSRLAASGGDRTDLGCRVLDAMAAHVEGNALAAFQPPTGSRGVADLVEMIATLLDAASLAGGIGSRAAGIRRTWSSITMMPYCALPTWSSCSALPRPPPPACSS